MLTTFGSLTYIAPLSFCRMRESKGLTTLINLCLLVIIYSPQSFLYAASTFEDFWILLFTFVCIIRLLYDLLFMSPLILLLVAYDFVYDLLGFFSL